MQASSQRSSQRLSRSTVPSTPAYNELHCKGFVILRGEVSRSDCRKLRDGATRECYEPILRDKLRLVAFNFIWLLCLQGVSLQTVFSNGG